jgi:hypothetical protein
VPSDPATAPPQTAPLPCEEQLRPVIDPETGIDLCLIQENLKMTPWERILANDDTINFIDAARAALKARNAAS